ncbi:MAG: alpha/beta hydrolase [Candidatus Saccharimonadales bacterium]
MSRSKNDVAYWKYHDPTLPTCVFIHGFTGSHEGFQYIIPELKKYHIIVPDLPGFGESKLGLESFTIDELANSVNNFIRDLQLKEPPYIIGHSMGGLVVASMLAQAPELFNPKAVLVSPVATKVNYLDSRKIGEFLGRLQFYLGKTVPGAGPRLVKSRLISRISTAIILTANQPKLKKQIRDHHFKNLDYISSIDFYYQLHVNINKKGAVDYAPELNKKFTVRIITGDKDNVTPLATEKKLHQALSGSELHVIRGVGHLLHYERPKEVAEAIREFLSR